MTRLFILKYSKLGGKDEARNVGLGRSLQIVNDCLDRHCRNKVFAPNFEYFFGSREQYEYLPPKHLQLYLDFACK